MPKPLLARDAVPSPAPELVTALATARAALDERKRLAALQSKLTGDLVEAERGAVDHVAAVQDAETSVVLSPDPADPELGRKAAQARATAEAAANQVTRLRHALAGLPERLAAADVALEAAQGVLAPLMVLSQTEAWGNYTVELHQALTVLASVLRKGHALDAASGPGMSRHLAGMVIPDLAYGAPAILAGGTLRDEEGAVIDLAEAWRRDPAAALLHDQHAPFYAVLRELDGEARRIQRAAEDARYSKPSVDLGKIWDTRAEVAPPNPRPEYVPPKGTFVPNSWTIEQRIAAPVIPSDKFHRPAAPADTTHPHGS